jgi:N6-L-threonylcarbamoyladenine synthase
MILGVDTSNYTTSMCLLDAEGRVLIEMRELLKVKPGAKGLRQSDAFYQHVHVLTELYAKLIQKFEPLRIEGIAVSNQPRYIEDSYMPVFNAGVLFCKNLGMTIDKPVEMFSHQEGHLVAALRTSGLPHLPERFYGLHLSGGTTELLRCTWENERIYSEKIGGTLDLNMGQLIDRIGVKLGLDFPCGKAMDLLAQKSKTDYFIRLKLKSEHAFNLSGLENKFHEIMKTHSPEDTCKILFNTLAFMLSEIIALFKEDIPIVMSGGVASNSIVREQLIKNAHIEGIYFSKPKYASDNAYGTASLGLIRRRGGYAKNAFLFCE